MLPVPVTIADPDDPRLEPYARMRERDLVGRAGRFIVEGEVTL
ncbi:MAG: RNA methyltransferase, partial [Caulobacteraceae bacterium]|nr:RNA methyltransferase [Caulobacter sp.]